MTTFELHINSIEDAILATLAAQIPSVKQIELYTGELDAAPEDDIKRVLQQLKTKFPLILAGYTDGKDTEDPASGRSFGDPLVFRHNCSFIVFCCAGNVRGASAQKRGRVASVGVRPEIGVVEMISQVREALSGLQFLKTITTSAEGVTPAVTEELALCSPLIPVGVEYVAKMPNITVYAVIFDTYFRWSSKDRTAQGINVDEIILQVDVTTKPSQSQNGKPGVTVS
ncbi:MAG TPA: phage protein Gp37 [Pyrinomonadaceae bacterium]|jgi:hypothetical protein